MVEVTCSKKIITIKGHAGYASKGQDIVCSAISILITTTINQLEGFNKKEIKVKEGDVTIKINHPVSENDQIRLDMLINGLKLISKKYPKNIKIKEK